MSKKIGGPVNRPIKRTVIKKNKSKTQGKALEQNRKLGLKQDLQEAKSAQVDDARQHVKTDKDKELKKPEERVTLSTPREVNKAEETEQTKAENQTEQTTATGTEQQQAPVERESDKRGMEFLNTFQDAFPKETQKSILTESQAAISKLSDNGANEVNGQAVLAAVTYNHAQKAIAEKMPGATPKQIRAAAKKDPEIANNLKAMDTSKNYMLEVKKEKAAENAKGGEAAAGGNGAIPPNGGDGSSAATGAPSDGGSGPMAADPFAGRSAQGVQGGQDGEKPLYHKSPEEQAQLIQERNQQMNEIMKVWAEMMAENRKAMMERHQLMMETNKEIMQIFQSIHINRARASQQHHSLYVKLMTESWG